MKISFDMANLVEALDLVSIVSPKIVNAAGFLFVVSGETCSVYSRDTACVARAQFLLKSSDGDGSFIYPAEYIGALRILADTSDTCELEAVEDSGKFTIRYHSSSGAKAERGTFDPCLLETCDQDLEEAEESCSFDAGLLREALNQARPYIAKDGADEALKGVQILDASLPQYAKGDGAMFVSDSTRMFYFRCSAFIGKSLDINGLFLGNLINFLARASGQVRIKKGRGSTFVLDSDGNVFGWPKHSKGHAKFGYYSMKMDQYVLSMPKVRMTTALQHIRSELDSKEDKIKLRFDPESRTLMCELAAGSAKVEGIPILVNCKQAEPQSWSFPVNINQMLDLFTPLKGHEVDLRVRLIPASGERRNDMAMFRTVETFNMDPQGKVVIESEGAYECQVTRFMPSKG